MTSISRPRVTYANVVATAALIIAVFGAGIPQAAAAGIRAAFATNAGAVDGLSASRRPTANQLYPLNKLRKFPAAVLDLSSVYTRSAANARFVAKGAPVDAATVGGQPAGAFLGASAKAADANTLDGIDSAGFMSTTTALSSPASSNYAGIERFAPLAIPTRSAVTTGGGTHSGCLLGELRLVPYNFEPVGMVAAHGQTVSIASNTALFSLLGTRYGGNGTTTFQLPDTFGLAPAGMTWMICVGGIFPSSH